LKLTLLWLELQRHRRFRQCAIHYSEQPNCRAEPISLSCCLQMSISQLGRREQSESAARGCLTRVRMLLGRTRSGGSARSWALFACLSGRNDRAVSWTERAICSIRIPYGSLQRACTYAVVGKPEVALECLEFVFSQCQSAALAVRNHQARCTN